MSDFKSEKASENQSIDILSIPQLARRYEEIIQKDSLEKNELEEIILIWEKAENSSELSTLLESKDLMYCSENEGQRIESLSENIDARVHLSEHLISEIESKTGENVALTWDCSIFILCPDGSCSFQASLESYIFSLNHNIVCSYCNQQPNYHAVRFGSVKKIKT